MTLEQLKHLAEAGVKIEISAADLLQALKDIAAETKTAQSEEKRGLTLTEAAAAYCRSTKSIVRYIQEGVIRGWKVGGAWLVESPDMRAARLENMN